MDKQKQTFSVLFWLRKGRAADNTAPLFCRVTISGQRYEIPMNLRISPTAWSTHAQRVLGRSAADKEANHCIERMQNDIEQTVLKIQKKNGELTIENFRLNFQTQDNEYSTLTSLFEYHKVIKGKAPAKAPTYQAPEKTQEEGYICTVCGYFHKGELPPDFKCPVCGVPAEKFKKAP